MAQVCEDCKLWRKNKYWNEFSPKKHHFFKVMIYDFESHMRIPTKFVTNFKGKLLQTVTLRGPSGSTWKTTLSKKTEECFILEKGWNKFVNDNGINCGDFLVFTCDTSSIFDVLIFDPSCCEREDSFFADNKRIRAKSVCCSMRVDNSTFDPNSTIMNESFKEDDYEDGYMEKDDSHIDSGSDGTYSGTVIAEDDIPLRYPLYYISKRRKITREDKKRAYDLASRHTTKRPSCRIRMKPSHVYHGFILTIPREWSDTYLPNESQEIQLKVPPGRKKWKVHYKHRTQQSTFNKGWDKFVLENNLEEDDYCVLELVSSKAINGKKTTLLDVFIYRVVDEVSPLKVLKRPIPKC